MGKRNRACALVSFGWIWCMTIGLTMLPASTLAEPDTTLLDQAIHAEQWLGDLDAAIDTYESIATDPNQHETTAAHAQLRLGFCHLKQGDVTKAAKSFRRVIEHFPNEIRFVDQATEQLARLGVSSSGDGPREYRKAKYSLILDKSELEWDARAAGTRKAPFDFSPDGKRFVFQAPREDGTETKRFNETELYISDRTGTLIQPLFPNSHAFRSLSRAYPRWSPDGSLIAFTARRADEIDAETASRLVPRALFVIVPGDAMPRQIGPEFNPLAPIRSDFDYCWTPDGAALTRFDEKGLHTFDLDGQQIRSVPMETSRSMRLGGYSPDGRWLVFSAQSDDVPVGTTESHRYIDLWLLPSEGGRAIQLTDAAGLDGHAAWGPNSNEIYYVSEVGGSPAPYGGTTNIWKLRIDPESGLPRGEPEQVTFFNDAILMHPKLLNAGDELAFALHRITNAIHAADWSHPEQSRVIARGREPRLSPDGKTVVYRGEGPGQDDLFAVSSEGGTPLRLTQGKPTRGYEISPDGKTVAYGYILSQPGIFTVPLTGGEHKMLVDSDNSGAPQWSPDGSRLAYADDKSLYIIDANGGEPVEIARLYDWDEWTVRWSPDGSHIAALGYRDPEMHGVFVVPASGGEPRLLTPDEEDSYIEQLEWHPDGQRIAYTGQGTRIAYLDGRPTTVLVDRPDHYDYIGKWHPDGRSFYFVGLTAQPRPQWALFRHDVGMEPGEVLEFNYAGRSKNGADGLPDWSDDGETMVWVRQSVTRQLWTMENFR